MKLLANKWVILAILTLTWGTSFILIKHSIKPYTPLQVGALRLTIAGLAVAWVGVRSFKYIPKKLWKWVILAGALGNFIPMFLFPFAQKKVSSSVAGILDSLVPIFVLIFGFLLFRQKSSFSQVIGAVIGFGGAVLLIGYNGGEASTDLFSSLLIILATIFYGINGLIIDNYLSEIPSFRLSAVLFTFWLLPSFIILLFSGFFQEFHGTPEQWRGLGFVSILGIVSTAIAIILYYKLIQMTSAVFASVVTYLMPLVALMWGFLDGERLSWLHFVGGALIIGGIYLIQWKPKKSLAKTV